MSTIKVRLDNELVEQVDRIAKQDGMSWDEAAIKLVTLALNERRK